MCFLLLNYLSFCLCLIQICEHYIVRGLCDDHPDWLIAAPGSETSVKIGYEYGHSVTGEEQQIKLNLDKEAFHTDSDQVVPDPQEERSMVATSAEVPYTYVYVTGHGKRILSL